MQQIPRANVQIKPLFKAPEASEKIEEVENTLSLFKYEEVNTDRGWIKSEYLTLEDILIDEENNLIPILEINDRGYKLDVSIEPKSF